LLQLKLVVRAMYSNPPIHGARIVAHVLGDARLKALWYEECKGMADRCVALLSTP
jgi:aspartate/tyrosine/aromatic aminotransferase